MYTPHIIFQYSQIYDELFKDIYIKEQTEKDEYPSSEVTKQFIKSLEEIWKPYERSILEELSKITTLPWKEELTTCYVVGRTIPFSDPLTIPAYKGHEDYGVDVLTHEMIHRLFVQPGNYEASFNSWQYIHRKYEDYSENTRIHIPLVAIHSAVYLKLFDKIRLNRDKRIISSIPDYKTAWDIVEKDGYTEIIEAFIQRLRK